MRSFIKWWLLVVLLFTLSACRWEFNASHSHRQPALPLSSISGVVSGLSGTGLTLQNAGGNTLAVATNGTFTFTSPATKGNAYSVAVLTQPVSPSQLCSVTYGSGKPVTTVQVACVTQSYTVSGSASGLAGSGLVLQNNAGDNLPLSANSTFTFTTPVTSGSAYSVTVLTQPVSPGQKCTVTNGSATMAGTPVTNVQLACIVLGDVNGDGVVDHKDAILAQRIALGMITATPDQLARGDIHEDGAIDISDYFLIQKLGLGL